MQWGWHNLSSWRDRVLELLRRQGNLSSLPWHHLAPEKLRDLGSDLPKSSDSSGFLLLATSSYPPISRALCILQTDVQEGFYRETGFVCCAFLLLCRRPRSWGETMADGGHRKETVIAEILGTVG